MRILIVHEARSGAGGVESYLAALIPALLGRGHAMALLHYNSRRETGAICLDHPGVPGHSVADDGLEAVVARLEAWRPDVCFSHNMRYLDVEDRLLARWPVVKMMHGFFGTCLSGHKTTSFPSPSACARRCGPGCLAHYLPRRCGQLRPLVMIDQYRWAVRQRSMFPRYAGIVVASEYMRDEYARYDMGRNLVAAVPLFPAAGPVRAPRARPADPSVLFMGRMVDLKGGQVLIDAAAAATVAMTTPVRVVLAGDGPERARWTALAARRGVHATFTGWVNDTERSAAFAGASVLAVPSLWPEPFGLVGLEAGAHGVPAVAFDVGGIRQWLHDGVNGLVVTERGSASALGAALAAVLGNTADLDRLSAGAHAVAGRMSIDTHLDRLEPVLATAARPRASIA